MSAPASAGSTATPTTGATPTAAAPNKRKVSTSESEEEEAVEHPPKKAKDDDTHAVEDVDLGGKKFVVVGAFSCEKFRIESTIGNLGGEISKNLDESTDFFVCGTHEADDGSISDLESEEDKEAKKMKIRILNEAEFQTLVTEHKATKLRLAGNIKDGLLPDLTGIVADYADSEGIGAQWAEICGWLGIVNTPATEDEIATAEARIKIAFPPYLKDLWRVAKNMGHCKHSRDYDPHPCYIFPSIDEVVGQYEGTDNLLGANAQDCWDELGFLPLWNYHEAGDQYTVINLAYGWVLCIDFDHEGESMDRIGMSLPQMISQYHCRMKAKVTAFDARIALAGDSKSEVEVAREADVADQISRRHRRPDWATMRATHAATKRAAAVAAGADEVKLKQLDQEEIETIKRSVFNLDSLDYEMGDFEDFDPADEEVVELGPTLIRSGLPKVYNSHIFETFLKYFQLSWQ